MGSITFEKFCRRLIRKDAMGEVGKFVEEMNDNRDLIRKCDYVFAYAMLTRRGIHEALKNLPNVPAEQFREQFRRALNVR